MVVIFYYHQSILLPNCNHIKSSITLTIRMFDGSRRSDISDDDDDDDG